MAMPNIGLPSKSEAEENRKIEQEEKMKKSIKAQLARDVARKVGGEDQSEVWEEKAADCCRA